MLTPIFALILTTLSAWAGNLELDAANGKITAQCKSAPAGATHVWLFKQWHADPAIDTHDRGQAKNLPQAANQTAIYRQLDHWVGAGSLKTVVAEGCVGEMSRASHARFNGWTVADLESEAKKPHFDDEIVTSIPLKLEAKYGAKVRTLCGDDKALIRDHQLAFSDVRGTYGFLSRLLQYKDDPKRAQTYLDGVIELYKLPKATTLDQAVARMRTELRAAMERLKVALDKRNEKLVSLIQGARVPELAVVYGGIHAPGLVKLLEAKGLGCTVVEPTGYNNDEAALMDQLEAAMKQLGV